MPEAVTQESLLFLIPAVMAVARLYASVGMGGNRGYLAVMSLIGMSAATMAPAALRL